jgi:hypothetical protein
MQAFRISDHSNRSRHTASSSSFRAKGEAQRLVRPLESQSLTIACSAAYEKLCFIPSEDVVQAIHVGWPASGAADLTDRMCQARGHEVLYLDPRTLNPTAVLDVQSGPQSISGALADVP